MSQETITQKRDGFSSRFGLIAAAAGSAVGLGNIWKFPYIVGENGGSAFILIYLISILGVGLPVLLAEFIIGRRGGANAVRSFKKLAPNTKWPVIGWLGIIAAFMILGFYTVIAGYTIHYFLLSLTNAFSGMSSGTPIYPTFLITCCFSWLWDRRWRNYMEAGRSLSASWLQR